MHWIGILLWSLAVCALLVLIAIALLMLRVFIQLRRRRSVVGVIRERVKSLTNDQLTELMRTPAHSDSPFALAELMRRGVKTRPSKEQLFGMLTSGNPGQCGHAIVNLQMFYPELRLPKGLSNLDPPDSWRAWIESVRPAS